MVICECAGEWLELSMDIGVKVCKSIYMKVVAAGISREVRAWDVLEWHSCAFGSGACDG